jgi:hypothetical protein
MIPTEDGDVAIGHRVLSIIGTENSLKPNRLSINFQNLYERAHHDPERGKT